MMCPKCGNEMRKGYLFSSKDGAFSFADEVPSALENAVTTATTLIILALLGFIGWSVWGRAVIQYWGRRSAILLVFGLVVCCFAAARDGLDKTIQHTIDGSCAPGLFPLVSVPTIIGCVGALLIIIAAIATPIAKTQKMREAWFYVMSGGAVLKIVTMEIARIIL